MRPSRRATMFGKPRCRSRTKQMEPVNLTHGHISRRHFLQVLGFLATNTTVLASGEGIQARGAGAHENNSVEYGRNTLPLGVRSRRVDTNNGVVLHVLEAGFERPGNPCVVLLHGFPELAYCWRNQLLPLARAGFHVVAPDLRGYGLSAAKAVTFADDLTASTGFSVPTRGSMPIPARRSTSRLVTSEARANGPFTSLQAHLNACTRHVRGSRAFTWCTEPGIPLWKSNLKR
jgi:hypothetical protein